MAILLPRLTFHWTVDHGTQTISGLLVSTPSSSVVGARWLGVGVAGDESGAMTGGWAVIGQPGTMSAAAYNLGGKASELVTPDQSSSGGGGQLIRANVSAIDGTSELSFEAHVGDGATSFKASGPTVLIAAHGMDDGAAPAQTRLARHTRHDQHAARRDQPRARRRRRYARHSSRHRC